MKRTIALLVVLTLPAFGFCQKEPNAVSEIAKEAGDSIVVVTVGDRQGDESALGTGFVIDEDGLIATNLHVIGEARPVWIQMQDGTRHEVTEVFASDRTLDLAVVRVRPAEKLTALPLTNDGLSNGQAVVAIGHPLGLKNSVVSGVVAGERDFGSAAVWQVAMTIERGNSGSPLLDMQGNVHGVVAMKSTGREPFGFAVKVDLLKKLMEQPNPISMAKWKTIGQIDSKRWQAKMGARWRQRSGRLLVEGAGKGFGGRSLLLRADDQPTVPFEMSVMVKLENESGAAGLVFHSDNGDRHYGFYPSGGRLRLTSFEGPTVFTWKVISELESEVYKRGDWNEIKIRVEEKRIIGFVNGHETVNVNEVRQAPGSIGLCKFRDTRAEFKHFRFGAEVPSAALSTERLAELTRQIESLSKRPELLDIDLIGQSGHLTQRMAVLEGQARKLEQQAAELRKLAQDIHVASVSNDLRSLAEQAEDEKIDLLQGALLIAKLDNPELDVQSYLDSVDTMASTIRKGFEDQMSQADRLAAMDDYLFKQNGFHGSRSDYYNEANSHLDRVIDDREGLPVTLSVLYLSLAKRLELDVVGIGLPGHFVVRHEPKAGKSQLIDVFERGKRLSRNEANVMVFRMTGQPPSEDAFEAAKQRDILLRMLTNLRALSESKDDSAAMLRYTEGMVALDPENPEFRGMRGVLRHRQGRRRAALDDIDWILEKKPAGVQLEQVRRMRELFAK